MKTERRRPRNKYFPARWCWGWCLVHETTGGSSCLDGSKWILKEDGIAKSEGTKKGKTFSHNAIGRCEYGLNRIVNKVQRMKTMDNGGNKWILFLFKGTGTTSLDALSRMRAIPKTATRDDLSRDPIFCRLATRIVFSSLFWVDFFNNYLSLLNGSVASRHYYPWLRSWMSSVLNHARSLSGIPRLRACLLIRSRLDKVIPFQCPRLWNLILKQISVL